MLLGPEFGIPLKTHNDQLISNNKVHDDSIKFKYHFEVENFDSDTKIDIDNDSLNNKETHDACSGGGAVNT